MKRIVLLGAGHANLEIIKHLSLASRDKSEVTLISESRTTFYSGLLPRLILGEIQESELTIDLEKFCKVKNVRLICDSAELIEPNLNRVQLRSGNPIDYDYLVINTGGVTKQIETENPFRAVFIKPLNVFIERWREIQRICSACQKLNFVVIGGGAASVELAVALKLRLMSNQSAHSQVNIVTNGNSICENYTPEISNQLKKSLTLLGIGLHFGELVSKIPENELLLASGVRLPFDYVFASLPVAPPKWNFYQSLEVDQHGYFNVDDYLRCKPNVYAAGDCAKLNSYPDLARSGVNAVRQGQYLAEILSSVIYGKEMFPFRPSKRQLNILVSGRSKATLIYGSTCLESSFSLKTKNWIDEKYMRSFRI